MTEEQKKQIAAFRFGVICELVNGARLNPGEQARLIRDKCARRWQIPHSEKTRISRGTLLRWVSRYRAGNERLESLYPQDRSDRGKSRRLDEETALSLIQLRKELPRATVAHLIEQMQRRGLLSPPMTLSPSTVYRLLHGQHLMHPAVVHTDRRKFEAECVNDLWQSDVMHGPQVLSDGKHRKAYLIAVIDDHSRLIPHAEFYLNERLSSYVEALQQALSRRGLPRKLYVDNGSAFRCRQLEHICAQLGIALIHSKPYTPEGRGKIERFFRTVRGEFLAGFKGDSLRDLNEALELWLTEVYHRRTHSATGQSPFARFTDNLQCVRSAPENLNDYFRHSARRRVAKDRCITLNGTLYEAPVALIGCQVELLYHPEQTARVEVRCQNQSYGFLHPVDVHVNCRVKRHRNRATEIATATEQPAYRGGALWGNERKKTL
jgi:transposase InsO family protein